MFYVRFKEVVGLRNKKYRQGRIFQKTGNVGTVQTG